MPKLEVVNAKNIIESNPEKAFFKLKNTGGPKGDTGAQGIQGPKGDTGPQGAPGASASVTVGSTTTLSPGADATVTNSGDTRNAILNFGIPTGAQGPQGIQGPKGDTGPMGQTGAKGDTGAAATVQVGNTNTGAPGTNAQVTNAGNEHFAVFNFTIPRGDKGETGSTGAQGPKGDKGDKGDTGTAATITVGSTTTTNPGTNATVTNSGTTSSAVLNFGIPRGATGSVKSDVVSELPETGEGDTFYLVNREATEQTATGKAINFTNSDNSGDITDFKLLGETSQNGTPTPSAPVAVQTVTGENVVKISDGQGNEQSYPISLGSIELCKIGDYQDYIYKSGGKWYVYKEVDRKNLNGSEEWDLAERSGNNNGVFYIDYSKIGTVGAKNNGAFSNYAHFISGFVYKVGQFDTHYSQWRFYAPNNTITLNEWKANLASAPLVLYYLLAAATEEEITNEALVAQLNNVASAPLYTGANNITTITPNEQGTLEIKYVTYDKYNQNKVYIWNDTLQQWQIIVS